MSRPLPRTSGKLSLAGLAAPVQVIRDRWGVPHIYAQNLVDLFMAQGYVHAQDRLWQMELQRRTGHGQLAEAFGPIALDADAGSSVPRLINGSSPSGLAISGSIVVHTAGRCCRTSKRRKNGSSGFGVGRKRPRAGPQASGPIPEMTGAT